MDAADVLVELAAPAETGSKRQAPVIVGSSVFARPAFPSNHPLAIRRVAAVEELCRLLGWLDHGYVASERATRQQLLRFHDAAYVDALERASRESLATADDRDRFNLGTMSNPIFPGVFERASTSVGGSILAARLAMEGRLAFHPAGGTHHGGKARANGFCYFNDPVFAVLEALDRGARRVAYVDFDAHHGDGVEDAFADDPRVLTISIHEEGRWPHTGVLADRRSGNARNLPVPRGLNDDEFRVLVELAVAPLVRNFSPGAIVLVCGADALKGDPLAKLSLSGNALWDGVETVSALAPAVVVLGGGGYNPWTLVRCWSGLWGRLVGLPLPKHLPGPAKDLLASFTCDLIDDEEIEPHWLNAIADPPNVGAVRPEIEAIIAAVTAP